MNALMFISGVGVGAFITTSLMLWMFHSLSGKKAVTKLETRHAETIAVMARRNELLEEQNEILNRK